MTQSAVRVARAVLPCVLIALLLNVSTSAQDTGGQYVTRDEYESLLREMHALRNEIAALKKSAGTHSLDRKPEGNVVSQKEKATTHVTEPTIAAKPDSILGTSNFHLAGFGVGTFEDQNGGVSNFSATFNPTFLWELSPRLLFEGRLELELSGSGTNLELEYAQLTYLLNDYVTLGAGEFLTPSNVFVERFEALWIDKLPDRPLAVYDGILPERSIGVEVRGGIPIGPFRADYAFYVSNGPNLNAFDAARAGTLEFNNFTDNNDNKAVGGRVGFLPIAGVEIGYGFEVARPGTQGGSLSNVGSLLQSIDLNVTRNSELLKGRIDLHAQYAWSSVDSAIYDPTGTLGFGPLRVAGKRDGGYGQIAYRPSRMEGFLRDTELVFRWDHLSRAPSGLGQPAEQRWTLGLDYWLTPAVVLKAAYEWDQPSGQHNANAFLLQSAVGF